MPKQAILFLLIFVAGSIWAIKKGPFYGLLAYIHVYFNIPTQQYWGPLVPDLRWSFTCAGILIFSCILYKRDLSDVSIVGKLSFKLLLGYLSLIILTAFWSPFSDDAYTGVYDFFRYVVIFYLMAKIIVTDRQYEWVITLFVAEMFNISLFAQSKYHGGRLEGVGTVDASDANHFAGLVAITIFLMVGLLIYGHKYIRIGSLLSLPFILNAFMMCSSRGAFLSLGIGAILMGTIIWSFSKLRWKKWQLIAAGILSLVLLVRLMSPDYKERVRSILKEDPTGETAWEEVSAGRTTIWKAGIEMAERNPYGYGTKGFIRLSTTYLPEELIEKTSGFRASHNTFILTLVEQGVLGMLLYTAYFFYGIRTLERSRRRLAQLEQYVLPTEKRSTRKLIIHCIGLESAIVCLLVHSVFADRLYFEILYWLGAFAISLSYIIEKKAIEIQSDQATQAL